MPVSQKPRKPRTNSQGKLTNPVTHVNGLPVNKVQRPWNFIFVFKRNAKGQLMYRNGKLLVDWAKSDWVENPRFMRKYGISPKSYNAPSTYGNPDGYNVKEGFGKPITQPNSRDSKLDYLLYCTEKEYRKLTGKFQPGSRDFKANRFDTRFRKSGRIVNS